MDFSSEVAVNNELSLAEIEKFTKKLGGNLFNINLTGGEPFLRGDIFEIVSLYCKNTSVQTVNIATNGMFTGAVKALIDKFRAEKFRQKLMFSISVDNFQSLHNENRGIKGLYENAIKTYKLVESFGSGQIVPTIAITVTPYNYSNVIDLYTYLKKEGIRSFFAILMREEGAIKNIEHKKDVLDAYRRLAALINTDQLQNQTAGMRRDFKASYLKARTNLVNGVLPKIYLTKKFISYCSAGTLFGVIYANGDVFLCEILNNYNFGNIRDYDMDFRQMWDSNNSQKCREYIKRSRCSCTFECAWSVNIISNIKFIPQLFFYLWKNLWSQRKK